MAKKNSTLKSVANRLLPRSLVWRRELEELRTEQHRRQDALSDEIQGLKTELVSACEDAARREAELKRRLAAELAAARDEAAHREAELQQRLSEVMAASARREAELQQQLAAELAAARDDAARREAELLQRFNSQLAESAKVNAAVTAEKETLARQGQALRAELENAQAAHERRERGLQHRLSEVIVESARNLAEARSETAALRRALAGKGKRLHGTAPPAVSLSPDANQLSFYICHADHNHDRVFAENLIEYLEGEGLRSKAVVLHEDGQRPQLQECLRSGVTGVLGFNSQLDHSWIGSTNFLNAAAEKNIPVIQWILDHPSTRLPEFNNSTATNSRFLFSSADAEHYFRYYGVPGALTATVASVGPSRHSRLDELDIHGFANRPTVCLIAMNLRRPGGTIEEIRKKIAALGPPLSHAVEETIERGYLDLLQHLETHFAQALRARELEIPNATRHACMQMAEEVVQITRRQKIFEIAREFPLLIQSDKASRCFQAGATARFEENVGHGAYLVASEAGARTSEHQQYE